MYGPEPHIMQPPVPPVPEYPALRPCRTDAQIKAAAVGQQTRFPRLRDCDSL